MNEMSLKEIQLASLDILVEVDEICKKLGLKYFLLFGTLLGAIRHEGFIPWDDDIDIGLLRNDFDVLVKYFRNEYDGKLKLVCRENSKYYYFGIPRICDFEYRYISTASGKKWKQGVFIDIYPIDNYGSSRYKAKSLKKKVKMINWLYSVYANPLISPNLFLKIIKCYLSCILHIVKGKNWPKSIDDDVKCIINKYTTDKDPYLGLACWEDTCEIYRKDYFNNTIPVKFESKEFSIPEKYDQILKVKYGDYMQLPPLKDRVPHHDYIIYNKLNG